MDSDWWPLVWSPDPDLCSECKGRVEDDVDNGFIACSKCMARPSQAKLTRHKQRVSKRQRRAELYAANNDNSRDADEVRKQLQVEGIEKAKREFAIKQIHQFYNDRNTPSRKELADVMARTLAGLRMIEEGSMAPNDE